MRPRITEAEKRDRSPGSIQLRADILALFGEQTMKAKTSSSPRTTLKKGAATLNKRGSKAVAKPAAKKPVAKPAKAKTAKRFVKAAPGKTKSPSTPAKKPVAAVASVKTGAKSKAATTAAKRAAKSDKKPPLKVAATLVAIPPANSAPEKGKPAKKKREKVVRDSYSIPKSQYSQLKAMRTDLAKTGRIASKSELLRAGLALLFRQSIMDVKILIDALTPAPRGMSAKK